MLTPERIAEKCKLLTDALEHGISVRPSPAGATVFSGPNTRLFDCPDAVLETEDMEKALGVLEFGIEAHQNGHEEGFNTGYAIAVNEEAHLSTDPGRHRALAQICMERMRQIHKWGPQHHHRFIWSAILQEEVGEVAQECLEGDLGSPEAVNPEALEKELVQVAAVAVAWLEHLHSQKVLPVATNNVLVWIEGLETTPKTPNFHLAPGQDFENMASTFVREHLLQYEKNLDPLETSESYTVYVSLDHGNNFYTGLVFECEALWMHTPDGDIKTWAINPPEEHL